jgi:hypothetical protein
MKRSHKIALDNRVIWKLEAWFLHAHNPDGTYMLIKPARLGYVYIFRALERDLIPI